MWFLQSSAQQCCDHERRRRGKCHSHPLLSTILPALPAHAVLSAAIDIGKDACAGDEQFKEEKAVIIKEISSLKPSGGSRGTSPIPVRMSADGGRISS